MNKDWTAQEIVELYSQGMVDIEVCKELGITRRQFDKMLQVNPHFRETVERGRDVAEAWNLTQSRLNLHNKDFSVSLFNSRMQNLYNWSQKVDQNNKSLNVNAEMTKEELLKKLETYLPELLPKRDAPLQIEENPE
jgi:orotate phosphoribosyltransferase-like protein